MLPPDLEAQLLIANPRPYLGLRQSEWVAHVACSLEDWQIDGELYGL
jgi:hypothetical protein